MCVNVCVQVCVWACAVCVCVHARAHAFTCVDMYVCVMLPPVCTVAAVGVVHVAVCLAVYVFRAI